MALGISQHRWYDLSFRTAECLFVIHCLRASGHRSWANVLSDLMRVRSMQRR